MLNNIIEVVKNKKLYFLMLYVALKYLSYKQVLKIMC